MNKRVLISLAILAATGGLAFAAGSPADYNGDGRISREEFRNQVARTAFDADKNNDGFIDDSEMKFSDEQRKAMDADADSKVSVEEFQTGQMAAFAQLDKNGDGFLDAGEMGGGR